MGILHGVSHLGFLSSELEGKLWICISSDTSQYLFLTKTYKVWIVVFFPPFKTSPGSRSICGCDFQGQLHQLPGLAWKDWGERPVMPGKKKVESTSPFDGFSFIWWSWWLLLVYVSFGFSLRNLCLDFVHPPPSKRPKSVNPEMRDELPSSNEMETGALSRIVLSSDKNRGSKVTRHWSSCVVFRGCL